MTTRMVALVVTSVVAVAASVAVGWAQLRDHRATYSGPPTVAVSEPAATDDDPLALDSAPRIVFRHTGLDANYGRLASVSLDDPDGPRSFSDRECDRVDATRTVLSCLVTERGIPTRFESLVLDVKTTETDRTSLPGIPSRTRLSPSGRLVATTVFVNGHSYLQSGFSTRTVIRPTGDGESVDLEDLDLVMDGKVRTPTDRNYWGVTFRDDRVFWATVSTGARTWLVAGDLGTGRMATVIENAECPSISPDGRRVAYKMRVDDDSATPVWELAVRDLRTGEAVLLPATRGLDDQVEWLDDDTLLYGLPHENRAGVTAVWAVGATTGATPELLIEQAWSPAVVGGATQ